MDYSRTGSYRDRKGPLSSLLPWFGQRLALALADVAGAFDFADDQVDTSVDLRPGHLPQLI